MIDLWHDGCVSGPVLTNRPHPQPEDIHTGGVDGSNWNEQRRYPKGWVPPVQILAGWLRSLLLPLRDAKTPATAGDWAVIEFLSEEGLVTYVNGEPAATCAGKQFLKACGGMTPKGTQFILDEMPPSVFRYRHGDCPYVVYKYSGPHRRTRRECI